MGAATDAELLARVVRNPGRLALGPTNLALPFPFGGKSLGFTRGLELVWDFVQGVTRDPTSGVVTEVTRRRVEVPDLVGLAEGVAWDEDLLVALYTQTSVFGSGSNTDVRIEGTQIPAVVPAWQRVVFAADDARGKSVLLRRPVPRLVQQSMALALKLKCGLPFRLTPTPSSDVTGPFWQIARLGNLVL